MNHDIEDTLLTKVERQDEAVNGMTLFTGGDGAGIGMRAADEEICADCVKLTDALMALVKYGEIIHRWLSPANIKPYWYEDFVSDIKRAKKVLEEQKS